MARASVGEVIMAVDRVSWSPRVWAVRVPVRDEQMGDILSTSDLHFTVLAGMRSDLGSYASRTGRHWLVRADASLVFPRANGTYGSLFPDLLVAFDVDAPNDGPYRTHEVGKAPEFVAEILSDETATNDEDAVKGKVAAYADMGVLEYVTFDPRPRKRLALKGYRLVRRGDYALIPVAPEGGLWLETLQLRVVARSGQRGSKREPQLRFYTAAGELLLHADEEAAFERAARIAEAQQRQAAERQRVEAEQQRTEAERRNAEEHAARVAAERKIAELEAQLAHFLAGDGAPTDESPSI